MRDLRSRRGFSLLEVVVALGILTTGVGVLAQLATIAMRANANAAATTTAALLARDRMEQLRALAWAFDANGGAVSDLTTNLAAVPITRSGGTGLTPSPPDVLSRNIPGYCDFVSVSGRSLGGGATAPPDAAYVRRWSIAPLPAFAGTTLILQVFVTSAPSHGDAPHLPGEARLVTIKTRKAP